MLGTSFALGRSYSSLVFTLTSESDWFNLPNFWKCWAAKAKWMSPDRSSDVLSYRPWVFPSDNAGQGRTEVPRPRLLSRKIDGVSPNFCLGSSSKRTHCTWGFSSHFKSLKGSVWNLLIKCCFLFICLGSRWEGLGILEWWYWKWTYVSSELFEI